VLVPRQPPTLSQRPPGNRPSLLLSIISNASLSLFPRRPPCRTFESTQQNVCSTAGERRGRRGVRRRLPRPLLQSTDERAVLSDGGAHLWSRDHTLLLSSSSLLLSLRPTAATVIMLCVFFSLFLVVFSFFSTLYVGTSPYFPCSLSSLTLMLHLLQSPLPPLPPFRPVKATRTPIPSSSAPSRSSTPLLFLPSTGRSLVRTSVRRISTGRRCVLLFFHSRRTMRTD
jgi:hypothetical protein